jgi:hypothetical protein
MTVKGTVKAATEEVGEEAAPPRRVRLTLTLSGGPNSSDSSRHTSHVISMPVTT